MLIETTDTVAEIAYKCGFNNISNFNRVFKHKKLCIPKEFRKHTQDIKVSYRSIRKIKKRFIKRISFIGMDKMFIMQ